MCIQESELIISIPRNVMMTSGTAKASVLGTIDYLKYIQIQKQTEDIFVQCITVDEAHVLHAILAL